MTAAPTKKRPQGTVVPQNRDDRHRAAGSWLQGGRAAESRAKTELRYFAKIKRHDYMTDSGAFLKEQELANGCKESLCLLITNLRVLLRVELLDDFRKPVANC
jgi:hypothetical protein